ncbi:MAG TPA: hypothetical protein VJ835_01790 [Fimbriimonadaceae bacterium]|nr:hypothetical protein [Fimbriimonadaceae bacterium]
MDIRAQIDDYIKSQSEAKSLEIQMLHDLIVAENRGGKLWFSDGRNEEGKIVSNPNIGYGAYTIKYADGSTKEFFRIGLSANKSGISVYVLGLDDKSYLTNMIGDTIGKASVTGYCIKFKSTNDIDTNVLMSAIRHGFQLDI